MPRISSVILADAGIHEGGGGEENGGCGILLAKWLV